MSETVRPSEALMMASSMSFVGVGRVASFTMTRTDRPPDRNSERLRPPGSPFGPSGAFSALASALAELGFALVEFGSAIAIRSLSATSTAISASR